ncbi:MULTISPECIES: phosphomannomutase [unclassified Pseudoalteromonas]|uniref:phosphomannomutase n=1 Tax=unclassified Pseudoalteromonas TaxID=194690 RepID=UPI0020977F04|nr:phosphomannomutase [Pseudoalteromonas sp. XMcav2-N]MCO7188736.1 phosphomannomutase [Pseudoalteromonas sp. XMcav2-N]
MQDTVQRIIKDSGIAFGTSGARGLVEQFQPEVCFAFTQAFIESLRAQYEFDSIAIGIDNRPSSYGIALSCAAAAKKAGLSVDYSGVLPTPALALHSSSLNIPSIMVTGSHIPFDRNGLKFYKPDGEITKQDEGAILTCDSVCEFESPLENLALSLKASDDYVARYVELFNSKPFQNRRLGIYEHSSAGRDLYRDVFEVLGAEVISLGRSDTFVPIDTEAVSQKDRKLAKEWSEKYSLDAIFSTDGDGDRPLIADEQGNWLRGDVLGLLTAAALNVDALAMPVNCNTAVEKSKQFESVVRTRIGSPYVIDAFSDLISAGYKVAGFEANGGFLLASDIHYNAVPLKALPTRDALLPAIALFAHCWNEGKHISQVVSGLPVRFTASDRLKEIEKGVSLGLIDKFRSSPQALCDLVGDGLAVLDINETDGFRLTASNSEVVHLRPSGNAPELRCYAESDSQKRAEDLVNRVLQNLPVY